MRFNLIQVPLHIRTLAFLLAAGLFALAVTACGGGDPTATSAPAATTVVSGGTAPAATTAAPAATTAPSGGAAPALTTAPAMLSELSGDIRVDGSSTVFPITEAMAEEFGIATDGNVRITVGVSGTGGGFKKFCAGETHISDASRPIKQSEIDLCAEAGIEFIELPVAIDGLSVMVNPANDFVECMTVDELHTLWAPEAEDVVTKWSQVRAGWPEEDIRLYAPGVDSGTFDYFTETVNGESQASRGDFLPSEDDNVLVTGIAGDRGALGYFGYAYYAENADRLKLVAIDGGNGCITPTDETINNGTYSPLSRPLFIYVAADALDQPHVKAFVEFYLDFANRDLISDTGYIPFPDTIYGMALGKFQAGTTGAAFGGDARLHGTVEEVLRASAEPGATSAPAMIDDLSGDISVDGSSTVFPITEAMAEEFGIATDGNVRITVGVSGTGGGFKKFCAGETHISDASRPIKQSEIDLCAEAGIEFIELPVAIDGLSVMVNPANDFVECMTVDELHTLWAPEAEDVVTKWSQVRAGWPEEDIRLYAPGVDSGTFDYFTETVNGESQASRGDFLPSEDDNVLVTGIAGDRGALGYFGYAYYAENADRLKLVAIDGGNGCITPTDETINNGTYSPLSRPLFIYVAADALAQPHVKAFVEFYLDSANRGLISDTGYIPFPDTVYGLALQKVLNGTAGAAFGGDARLHGTVEEVLRSSS